MMRLAQIGLILLTAGGLLLSACAQQAGERRGGTSGIAGTPADSGLTGDFLKDCLARIPKDATAGQREVATRTCERNAAERATASRGGASSGAVEDSYQACLARIPKDASAGQRMIAEQSCERDEATRKGVQAVPGR